MLYVYVLYVCKINYYQFPLSLELYIYIGHISMLVGCGLEQLRV